MTWAGPPIYPVPVKRASNIGRWTDWPEDVVEILRGWNRGRLTFTRMSGVFKCGECEAFCEAHRHGACVLDGVPYCDDCMILMARRVLAQQTDAYLDEIEGSGYFDVLDDR